MTKDLSSFQSKIILLLILLVGFFLRIWGLGFGLPELYHADEPIVVNHALAYGLGDLNPHFFNIPPLTSYLLFLVYGVYFLVGFLLQIFQNSSGFLELFLKDPSSFYLLGRLFIGVFFGILSILMIYRLCRLLWSRGISLIGALLLAVLYLPVQLSHFIYPDSPLLFCLILSLFFYLRIYQKGSLRDYVYAAIATGAAISFKYNAAILFLPLLVTHGLVCLRQRIPKIGILGYPCFFAIVFIGVLFLLNPFFFLDHSFVSKELAEQAHATGFIGWTHHIFYSLKAALGFPLMIFVFLALLIGLYFLGLYPWLLIFYAAALAAYFHLVFFAQPYGRYGIFFIPPAVIFAMFLFNYLSEKIKSKTFLTFLLLTLILIPLGQSILLGNILSVEDNRTIAKRWIFKNIPAEASLVFDIDRFQPRLLYSQGDLEKKLQDLSPDSAQARRIRTLIKVQKGVPAFHIFYIGERASFALSGKRIPMDWGRIQKEGIQYFGLTRTSSDYPSSDILQGLAKYGTLIARFSPYRDPRQDHSFDSIDLTGAPTTLKDLLSRRRNGHLIEIYKLDFNR